MTSAVQPINKYDRQIRIWGDDGQSALQRASVCVVNATATATEILKNLVLPGIASFTIIDGQNVSPQDYATNFFLATPSNPPSSTPINRAQAVVNAMHSLNDSVRGSYIPVDSTSFLTSSNSTQAFLRSFSFVIVTQRSCIDSVSQTIARACTALKIPLLFARSYGQVAFIRLQLVEHCVQNARTADAPPDLRLYAPFPELLNHISVPPQPKVDTGEVDESHIPFVHILVRAITAFQDTHGRRLPQTRAEKDEFANLVRNSRPETCPSDAQNYVEALRYSNLRLCHGTAAEIPASVTKVFQATQQNIKPIYFINPTLTDEIPALPQPVRVERHTPTIETADAASLAQDRARWWACAAAIAKFYEKEKVLPLSGRIPDMTADTISYIALQELYSAQAEKDANAVYEEIVSGKEKSFELVGGLGIDYVKNFCKRIREIRLVRTRTLDEEAKDGENSGFADAARSEGAMDESLAGACASPYYVALRAADIFESEFSRLPGTAQASWNDDVQQMCNLVAKVKESLGLAGDGDGWRDVTEEVVRYGGVETHCVAAFVGGMAAQEAIKVMTGQFVPIEDCLVFNMANMTSVTFSA